MNRRVERFNGLKDGIPQRIVTLITGSDPPAELADSWGSAEEYSTEEILELLDWHDSNSVELAEQGIISKEDAEESAHSSIELRRTLVLSEPIREV